MVEAENSRYEEPASVDRSVLAHVSVKAAEAQVPVVGFGKAKGKMSEGRSAVSVLTMS